MSDSPWTAACQASQSLTTSQSFHKFMTIASLMPPSHFILWCPLLLPLIFPSIRDFSSESALHIRWPKYWSFSISPSNEYSGLIFLKIAWFDLLAVQRTLRCLLQHHNLEAWILALCLYWFSNSPLHLVTEKRTWLILGKRHGIFLECFLRKNSKEYCVLLGHCC